MYSTLPPRISIYNVSQATNQLSRPIGVRCAVLFGWQRRPLPPRQAQSATAEHSCFERLHLRKSVVHRLFGHRWWLTFGDRNDPDTSIGKGNHDGQCFDLCNFIFYCNKQLPTKDGKRKFDFCSDVLTVLIFILSFAIVSTRRA